MKRVIFFLGVAILATVLVSCGGKCDKNDPASKCYDPLTSDVGVTINGVT